MCAGGITYLSSRLLLPTMRQESHDPTTQTVPHMQQRRNGHMSYIFLKENKN
jgi:hypothetical protein